MTWALHPDANPRLVTLDALTAVHHAASGETHLLSAPVLALVERLMVGRADHDALAATSDLPDDQLAAELAALHAAGLIVPA